MEIIKDFADGSINGTNFSNTSHPQFVFDEELKSKVMRFNSPSGTTISYNFIGLVYSAENRQKALGTRVRIAKKGTDLFKISATFCIPYGPCVDKMAIGFSTNGYVLIFSDGKWENTGIAWQPDIFDILFVPDYENGTYYVKINDKLTESVKFGSGIEVISKGNLRFSYVLQGEQDIRVKNYYLDEITPQPTGLDVEFNAMSGPVPPTFSEEKIEEMVKPQVVEKVVQDVSALASDALETNIGEEAKKVEEIVKVEEQKADLKIPLLIIGGAFVLGSVLKRD